MLTEETWCKGSWALDEHGVVCSHWSDRAVRRCLLGWLDRYSDWSMKRRVVRAIENLYPEREAHIGAFNDDERTIFVDVVKVLDYASTKVKIIDGKVVVQ